MNLGAQIGAVLENRPQGSRLSRIVRDIRNQFPERLAQDVEQLRNSCLRLLIQMKRDGVITKRGKRFLFPEDE